MGRNAELARRYAVWTAVVVLLLVGKAYAQSTPEDELRDLSDRMWLVESLSRDFPDSAFWRTWGPLGEDVEAALGRHPGHPGLTDLRNGIRLRWGTLLVEKGEPERARPELEPLLPREVAEKWRLPAASALAGLYEAEAGAAPERDAKVELLREAELLWVQANRQDEFLRVKKVRIRIQAEAGLEAYFAKRYDDALRMLRELEDEEGGQLPPGEPRDALEDVRTGTGILRLERLRVPEVVPGTPVLGGGRVRLTPAGAGDEWTAAAPEQLRWRTGSYRFELFVGDGAEAVVTSNVTIRADAPVSVEVPEKIPDGMVYVPASPENGVTRPFFIDRTEVTVDEYRAVAGSYSPEFPGGTLPAHGVDYEAARSYAVAVGKTLPTKEQWLWTAFEGASRQFPWEGTDATGRANVGTGTPWPVGSKPGGASPFGVLDMVGNVWEWLDSGEAIGAGFRRGATLDAYERQNIDPVRQPKPSETRYGSMDDAEKSRYVGYRVVSSGSRKNIQEVGLRCVLGL